MNLEITKNTIEIVSGIIAMLSILIAGSWTFWKFVLQREKHPKIQFDIYLNILYTDKNNILVEIILVLENVGLVRHEIDAKNFSVNIRYLLEGESIGDGSKKINYQTHFPNSSKIQLSGNNAPHSKYEIKKGYKIRKIVPKKWGNTYIDPGVKQKYSYVSNVPYKAVCILVKSKFNYFRKKKRLSFKKIVKEFHGAQKAFGIDHSKILTFKA